MTLEGPSTGTDGSYSLNTPMRIDQKDFWSLFWTMY